MHAKFNLERGAIFIVKHPIGGEDVPAGLLDAVPC